MRAHVLHENRNLQTTIQLNHLNLLNLLNLDTKHNHRENRNSQQLTYNRQESIPTSLYSMNYLYTSNTKYIPLKIFYQYVQRRRNKEITSRNRKMDEASQRMGCKYRY